MHAAGLLGQRFFKESSNWRTKVHTRLTRVSQVKKVSQIRKIAQKCLEILLLLYNLHIFASDQIKEESNKKIFFCLFEQLFEKLRATFWEISSNLWKAVGEALCHTPLSLVLVNLMSLLIFNWDVFALH